MKQIENTIKYFKTKGYNNISLIGVSFGGIVAMKIAEFTFNLELKKVFLRCPGSGLYYKYLTEEKKKEYEDVMEKGFFYRDGIKFTTAIIKDLQLYYPLTNIAKKIKVPVCIIHGDKDEVVGIAETIEFSRYIKNCNLHIIKGAGHNLEVNGDFSESLEILVDFFKE